MVFTEDEYRLWQMESREDAENGADDRRAIERERERFPQEQLTRKKPHRNEETFGGEAIAAGWSFEDLVTDQGSARKT